MTRYIIANRRAGRTSGPDIAASRHAVTVAMSSITAPIIAQQLPEDPSGRHIVIVDAENTAEIEQRIREAPPNLIIEPEILHYPLSPPPRDLRRAKVAGPSLMAAGASITLNVTGGGAPLGDATVYFYTRSVGGSTNFSEGKTNKNGAVRFTVPAGASPAAAIVAPRATYWPMIARGAAALSAPIECPPLPDSVEKGWSLLRLSAAAAVFQRVLIEPAGHRP